VTKTQETLVNLLSEIDNICDNLNIDYYLAGETLLYASINQTINPITYFAEVAIHAENINNFVNEIEKKNKTFIEGWMNNSNYPDFSLKLSDKNSTCFNINNGLSFLSNGIFVKIHIIRNVRAISRKNILIENMINAKSVNRTIKMTLKGFLIYNLLYVRNLFKGKEKYTRKYFYAQTNHKISGSSYKIGKKNYSKLIFEGLPSEVVINQLTFSSFPRYEDYLYFNYGKNWKDLKIKINKDFIILNNDLPYELFFHQLVNQNWTNKKFKTNKKIYQKLYAKKANLFIKKQQFKTENIVLTLNLKDYYLKSKNNIISLYNEKSYVELDKLLKIYFDNIENYRTLFQFDKEIIEIVKFRLRELKGQQYIKELKNFKLI